MPRSAALVRLALVFLLPLTGTALAVDEKWEIVTTTEITGMPFRMPATTLIVCVPPGHMDSEKMIPEKNGCTVSETGRSGNTVRLRMACPPPQSLSGEAEITRNGKDAYHGSLKAKGMMDGRAMEMRATYAGRKVGVCDAKPSPGSANGMPDMSGAGIELPEGFSVDGTQIDQQKLMESMQKLKEMYGQ